MTELPTAPPTDAFGLPLGIFGPIPEDAWALRGRLSALFAHVEDRLGFLVDALGPKHVPATGPDGATPRSLRGESLYTLIRAVRSSGFPSSSAGAAVEVAAVLERLHGLVNLRDEIAHSIWTVRADREIFMHRELPAYRRRKSTDGNPHLGRVVAVAELRQAVVDLARILDDINRLWLPQAPDWARAHEAHDVSR
ncbi:hypothetical protein [Sanguibacter massiliensis]|uniref:hypothetical protein n=1 Tax=Sanguibacter massiliensis TaxID=1973217 RepID=UPI000C8427E0|nr:hypothetical protein [Sanguibacter massiliensis]